MASRHPQANDVVETHRRTPLTLRKSLQRIHVLIILVSFVISGISLATLSLFALRYYAENNLQLVASTLSFSAQSAVNTNDADAAQDVLQVLGSQGQFAEGKIFNARRELLSSWHSANNHIGNGVDALIAGWLFPHPTSVPVVINQREVGRVWITGDASVIIQFIWRALGWLTGSLLITALISFYLSHRMHSGIIQGLRSIASVAHDVRKRRAFSQRVPSSEIAELNKLSMDFNCLLDELAEWQHHITRENASLAHQAAHDALTGLPNRAHFMRELQRCFDEEAIRERLAVLFIDGDRFKQINDTWGHAAGDSVLSATAERLRANLRRGDLVARFGGDEFAIILHEVASGEQAAQVARHILMAMEKPIHLPQGEPVQQSLSIGIAMANRHSSPEALLAQADAAMYHIKELGGGWYFSPTCWQACIGQSAQ